MVDPSSASGGHPTASMPSAILIIRHGEKPPDASDDDLAESELAELDSPAPSAHIDHAGSSGGPFGVDIDGNQDEHSLITRGWQRAGGLASFFDPSDGVFTSPLVSVPTLCAVPRYGDPDKHRTYQTVWPLALKLGTEPTVTVAVGKESDLAAWILQQDGVVLACWEHKHIIDLTTALGPVISGGDVPGPWPSDRFDIVVALTPDPAHPGSYLCTQIPQLLLAGDSSEPIPG